jgi:xylulokinase
MSRLFVGIDSSTQSTKLVVIDDKMQQMVYKDSVNYDEDLCEYNTRNGVAQELEPGVSESAPAMWIQALEILLQRLQQSSIPVADIACISVSGQQHGLVTLDDAGNLTRQRSKLWNDFSTEEECRSLTEAVGGVDVMIEQVGNSQRTGYTAAKIYHMARHEPEAFRKTATCFLVHNYINFYLTGGVRVMEPGDTSGMALWNPATGQWSQKVMNAISPDLSKKIPPLQPSDVSIGFISKDLVQQYGFNPKCRIDAGSGDNMYGAVGTGNVVPGIVTVSLGTSGTAYTCLEKAYVDPAGEIAAFCDSTGRFLPLLCVSNLANGYNAILKHFSLTHDDFNVLIGKTKPGHQGRLLIPWYVGERTPDVPIGSPLYFGFDVTDFTRENLCRAVLEGHILNLYDGFRKMPIKAKEIRLTGGMAQSPAWCQTIADIFEAETVPVEGEGAALGAALHAAWVYRKEQSEKINLADLVKPYVIMREDRRCQPIAEHVVVHRLQKEAYRALSERVRGKIAQQDPFALREKMIR